MMLYIHSCHIDSDVRNMVVDFNKEMLLQLSCFWPPEEVKSFAEAHNLLIEVDEKRSRSIGKKPQALEKCVKETSAVSQQSNESRVPATSGPPKAARFDTNAPAKPSRSAAPESSAKSLNLDEGLKRSNRVLSKKAPKKPPLAEVAKGKKSDNPFEEDTVEADNPFLDDNDDDDNPSSEKVPSNPFMDNDSANPFVDEDENIGDSGNPFLD